MTVVPYEERFAEAVREICLRTAGLDESADPKARSYTLDMYCNAYIAGETAFVLLDGSAPKGYIFCAENYGDYIRRFAPCQARIAALGGIYPYMVQGEQEMYAGFQVEYPAHLHIDILEGYTGCGGGRLLMNTLLSHLRAAGVPGVMLGVDTKNARAIAFYHKLGFSQLMGNEQVLVLGQRL